MAYAVWLAASVLAGLWGATALAQSRATIPALDAPVVDTTGTLDAEMRDTLGRRAIDLQRRNGSQLQILIVASTQPEDIAQYTQRVFDAWKLGREGVDDGVLLVVAKEDRRVRIQTGYGLEAAIPDVVAGRVIGEFIVPKFRAGDFAGGIDDASQQLVRLIDGDPLSSPMAVDEQLPSLPQDAQMQTLQVQDATPDQERTETPAWTVILMLLIWVVAMGLSQRMPILVQGLIGAGLAALFSRWFFGFWAPAVICTPIGFIVGLRGHGDDAVSTGSDRERTSRSRSDDDDRSSRSRGSSWSGGGGRSGGGGASGSW